MKLILLLIIVFLLLFPPSEPTPERRLIECENKVWFKKQEGKSIEQKLFECEKELEHSRSTQNKEDLYYLTLHMMIVLISVVIIVPLWEWIERIIVKKKNKL